MSFVSQALAPTGEEALPFLEEYGADGDTDTEIDWRAYVQQVEQYRNGERDYTLIKGDTGWSPQRVLLPLYSSTKSRC